MDEIENGDESDEMEVLEEMLIADCVRKPSFVPKFHEDHCRMEVVWDPSITEDDNALVGGRPPPTHSLSSADSASNVDDILEEELVQCQAASELNCEPMDEEPEVEQEILFSAQRKENTSENIDEIFARYFEDNHSDRVRLYDDPQFKAEVEEPDVELVPGAVAYSTPIPAVSQSIKALDNSASAATPVCVENSPVTPDIDTKAAESSDAEVDEHEVIEEEILTPVKIVRGENLFANSPIELVETNPLVSFENIEVSSVDDDECEVSNADSPYEEDADAQNDEVNLNVIANEQVLHHKIQSPKVLPNIEKVLEDHEVKDVATSGLQQEVQEEQVAPTGTVSAFGSPALLTASGVPSVPVSDHGAPPPLSDHGTMSPVKIDVTEHASTPEGEVSSTYSGAISINIVEPSNITLTNVSTVNNNNAAQSSIHAAQLKTTPKLKSKSIFNFFRRSHKQKSETDLRAVGQKEFNTSPRNTTASDTGKGHKKSGFLHFGSQERIKPAKSPALVKPVESAVSVDAIPDIIAGGKASSPSKSNIRLFEIMSQSSPEQESQAPVTITGSLPDGKIDLQEGQHEQVDSLEGSPVFKAFSRPTVTFQTTDGEISHPALSQYIVVVAIDFGTTFSGYAFSFVRSPDKIHMMARWEGGDPGVINQKTPSILLLTPEGEFHSFGYTARNYYHDLQPEESLRWMYFDKFKMTLYGSGDCSRQTAIVAANGRRFPALEAIKMTLSFFKGHALSELSDQCGTEIKNEDVRWIVTVPAIWNSPAKQFMRAAAYEAGLASTHNPDQLVVALEPEAASVHIRCLRLHQLVLPEQSITLLPAKKETSGPAWLETVSSKFKTVSRYMVVDCGGGTVDITVHDINAVTGLLQEVHKASGGPHGSCSIDSDFETLLCAIFGEDFIRAYRHNRPSGWVGLMMFFESRKRAASPLKIRQPLNISLPFSFIDYHRKTKGITVERAIADFGEREIRWSSEGMMRLSTEAMIILFKNTVDHIKEKVAEILNKVKGIQHIFLVGGLSESPILQHAMREKFGGQARIIIPPEANLAVLRGAVYFGLNTSVVSERRSKFTYGTAVLHKFVRGKHQESKMVLRNGTEWCKDVFDRFVVADQVVRSGETIVRYYTPATETQKQISVSIYCTESVDVEYVTEPHVTKCGTISLEFKGDDATKVTRRKIVTYMTFSDTEIKITAIDESTGKKVDSSVDFLTV